MNIHHLELFYYVARYGGITEAVRNMPYGIQQPAMSAQNIELEEFLGVTLFHRRPYSLTPAGEELYAFIRPFFEGLQPMANKLRGGVAQHIRIGASEIVLRDHLPGVLQLLRTRFPKLKVTLREGYQPQLEAWLNARELDVAVTLLDGKPPTGIQTQPLIKLPIVLMVHRDSPLKSAEQLWKRDRIEESLISLPMNETIYKNFQKGLARLGVDWFTSIEVSTVDLVETYVANGYGIGVSLIVPKAKRRPGIRVLPLEGFEPVTIGAAWQGKMTPILRALVEILEQAVQRLLEVGKPLEGGPE